MLRIERQNMFVILRNLLARPCIDINKTRPCGRTMHEPYPQPQNLTQLATPADLTAALPAAQQ